MVVVNMDIQTAPTSSPQQQCQQQQPTNDSSEGHHQRSSWYDHAAAMAAASFGQGTPSDMTDTYFKTSSYYGSYGKPQKNRYNLANLDSNGNINFEQIANLWPAIIIQQKWNNLFAVIYINQP